MKRNTIICLSILLLGCQGDTTGPDDDLSVAVQVTPSTFRSGDRVTVAITVSNHGSRAHKITGSSCVYLFEVTTLDEVRVAPGSRPCLAIGHPAIQLGAGKAHTYAQSWTVLSKGSTVLEEGYYFMRGAVPVDDRGILKSDAITIQINE